VATIEPCSVAIQLALLQIEKMNLLAQSLRQLMARLLRRLMEQLLLQLLLCLMAWLLRML
jgi:hypothetical protein